MDINSFMKNGINNVMKAAGRFYLGNRKGRAFLAQAVPQMKKSAALRRQSEAAGTHIPAFLIASVASRCNLRCAGCYARAAGAGCAGAGGDDLSAGQWARIFAEAEALGVSFILLAGGEPLMRPDVLQAAAARPKMVFPVFTNGTLLSEENLALFETNRNLIPVISIEGDAAQTDARRGPGTHARVQAAMARLGGRGLLFGASVTVTAENMATVLSESFLAGLREKGCGVAVFVEYVPAEAGTEHLALSEAQLAQMNAAMPALKARFDDMVVLAFPGDEAAMGGCLASGRGFFHINPAGGAEPCPFSPHSKYNLRDTPMAQVLQSDYFAALRELAAEAGPHTGGCVLFQRQAQVLALLGAR